MSLWSDYIKECGLLEIIEEPWGFVQFHFALPQCIFINDMYIRPEERKTGKGRELLHRVYARGRERGCTFCATSLNTASKSATDALAAALASGFYITPSGKEDIIALGIKL